MFVAKAHWRKCEKCWRKKIHHVTRGIVRSDANDSEAAGSEPSERGDSCRTERLQLRSRKRAFRERAMSVSRAEEARAVGQGTARETTCHGGQGSAVPVTSSAGVTAPGCRGHVTGHGFHGPIHSDQCRSRRRRAASGPGFRGGVGCRGSGFHQSGRAGQKTSAIETNEYEPSVLPSPRAPLKIAIFCCARSFVFARSQVLEFEPDRLSIPSSSLGRFLAPTRSVLPALPWSRAACDAPRLHAPRANRYQEKIVCSVTVLRLSIWRTAAVRQVRLGGSS